MTASVRGHVSWTEQQGTQSSSQDLLGSSAETRTAWKATFGKHSLMASTMARMSKLLGGGAGVNAASPGNGACGRQFERRARRRVSMPHDCRKVIQSHAQLPMPELARLRAPATLHRRAQVLGHLACLHAKLPPAIARPPVDLTGVTLYSKVDASSYRASGIAGVCSQRAHHARRGPRRGSAGSARAALPRQSQSRRSEGPAPEGTCTLARGPRSDQSSAHTQNENIADGQSAVLQPDRKCSSWACVHNAAATGAAAVRRRTRAGLASAHPMDDVVGGEVWLHMVVHADARHHGILLKNDESVHDLHTTLR